jgi:uncharacterized repeat protein (TIGR03803 family)
VKYFSKILFLLLALSAQLSSVWQSAAQTFTTLYDFTAPTGGSPYTNGDGDYPRCDMILSGSTLYGTALGGGANGVGTVFAVNTSGANFRTLHNFSTLNDLNNVDGAEPYAGLILSGNTLYGTASGGGTNGEGAVYAINTNGSSFTTLHSFTGVSGSPPYVNNDGRIPEGALIISGNTLYGTAEYGGTNGNGTVFAINTDGSSFRTLHTFAALPSTSPPFTNDDGANPIGRLLLSGDTLYGTTSAGGTNDEGTVFAVSTNGTGFKDLYHFTALSSYPYTNSDGAGPQCGLIMLGNTLYGTAEYGGTNGYGTLFAINSNGTGFTILHTFSSGDDGGYPVSGLDFLR